MLTIYGWWLRIPAADVHAAGMIGHHRRNAYQAFRNLKNWTQKVESESDEALDLAHIARFKWPKHYHFAEALPKNNYGKVLKTALRLLDQRK